MTVSGGPASQGDGFEPFPWAPVEPTFSAWKAVALGAGAAVLGALLTAQKLSEGEHVHALLTVLVFGFFSLIGFGLIPQRHPRGSFRYINATVMTRAERPTADSWVHLAPTRPARLPLLIAGTEATLALSALVVYIVLVLLGLAPLLNEDTGEGGYLLALVPVALLAVASGWVTALMIGRRIRGGSFGTRPSGVALGETSVTVRVPGRDVEIPWTQIKSVTARRTAVGTDLPGSVLLPRRHRGENLDLIRLALLPGGEVTSREQWLAADGYSVPRDAVYTALRWYHAHPEARWELGRVEGERRIEGWRRRALAAARRTEA